MKNNMNTELLKQTFNDLYETWLQSRVFRSSKRITNVLLLEIYTFSPMKQVYVKLKFLSKTSKLFMIATYEAIVSEIDNKKDEMLRHMNFSQLAIECCEQVSDAPLKFLTYDWRCSGDVFRYKPAGWIFHPGQNILMFGELDVHVVLHTFNFGNLSSHPDSINMHPVKAFTNMYLNEFRCCFDQLIHEDFTSGSFWKNEIVFDDSLRLSDALTFDHLHRFVLNNDVVYGREILI